MSSKTPQIEDVRFKVAGLEIAGKHWKNPGGIPTLCFHGWLDNAASFDFLAPLLHDLDLLCLDLPGHGRSSHRQDYASYTIWRDVMEIIALADKLAWQKFALLAHSRGAAIATILAGAFPERVTHMGLIEGIFPIVNTVEECPDQLRSATENLRDIDRQRSTVYSSFEKAVDARANGLFKIAPADARALAERAVIECDSGYTWLYDFKLKVPSEIRMNRAHVDEFLNRIEAPIKVVLGDNGYFTSNPHLMDWLKAHQKVDIKILTGGHHIHMTENCEKVARELNVLFTQ